MEYQLKQYNDTQSTIFYRVVTKEHLENLVCNISAIGITATSCCCFFFYLDKNINLSYIFNRQFSINTGFIYIYIYIGLFKSYNLLLLRICHINNLHFGYSITNLRSLYVKHYMNTYMSFRLVASFAITLKLCHIN